MRCLTALTLLVLSPACAPALEPGGTEQREATTASRHIFRLQTGKATTLHWSRTGNGFELTIAGPTGARLAQIRSTGPRAESGQVSIVAASDGEHTASIRPLDATASPVRYTLTLDAEREPTAEDRARAEAEAAMTRAGDLRRSTDANDRRRALDEFRTAAAGWERAADGGRHAATLVELAQTEEALGDRASATNTLERARALAHQSRDRRAEAIALQALATLNSRANESRRALALYREALEIRRGLGDRFEQGILTNNIAQMLWLTGDMRGAIESFREALEIRREVKDELGVGYTLGGIGAAHWSLDEYQKALDAYDDALSVWRKLKNRRGEADTLNSQGLLHVSLGNVEQARAIYGSALPIWREIRDRLGEARTLNNLGMAYAATGDHTRALVLYREALPIFQSEKDRRGEAYVLHNIGNAYVEAGDLSNALEQYAAALRLKREISDKYGEGFTLHSIGEAHRLLKQPDEARRHFGDALTLRLSIDDRNGRITTLGSLALLSRDAGQMEDACDRMAQALDLIESSRKKLASPELRASYFATKRDYYEFQIDALMKSGRTGDALHTAERARARSLLDMLADAGVEDVAAPPLSTAEIRSRILDPGTVLLEYSLGKDKSYGWAVTRDSVRGFELPARPAIETLARSVHASMQKPGDPAYPRAAARLARVLLGPVRNVIAGKRIAVVADGALQYIPFAALPDPASTSGEPLLLRHEVVALPSASVLAAARGNQRSTARAQSVAVLADPLFKSAELPRLRFSRIEADRILAIAPAALAFRAFENAARADLIRSGKLDSYRYIHIATHAMVDSRQPERTSVVFSDGTLRLSDIYRLKLTADTVVLSACRTALGKDVRGEGVIGLTRGFMHAGANRVIASLWNVEDRATAELMAELYSGVLKEGLPVSAALRRAQLKLLKDVRWAAPYYWAAFTLQGDWRN